MSSLRTRCISNIILVYLIISNVSVRSDSEFRIYWIALYKANFQGRMGPDTSAQSDASARSRRYCVYRCACASDLRAF